MPAPANRGRPPPPPATIRGRRRRARCRRCARKWRRAGGRLDLRFQLSAFRLDKVRPPRARRSHSETRRPESETSNLTSDSTFPVSDFGSSILDFRFQISDFRFQISNFRFQISNFRFQISNFKFQRPAARGLRGMRIALARRGYSATGGAETYLRRFAAGALAAGHECILYATEEWPESGWPGKIVRVTQASGPWAFAERLLAARANCAADIFFSLERVLACDVYRAGDGLHSAWLERRTHFEPAWRGWFRRWNRKHAEVLNLERTLFLERGTRQVIANSRMVKREIEDYSPNFPAESIHVIYNGAPQPQLSTEVRTRIRRGLGLEPADYALLFAGTGWDRKGLRFAIEAVNACNCPEAQLFVAGAGRAEAMPRSNRTRFLGAREDMPSLLAAADAFILPT